LRRIERLQDLGLVARSSDPTDRRRSVLVLSASAKASLAAYFAGPGAS
jgi:DNA-binding MarR family transcriptional regulator